MIDTYWSDHCRHTTFGTILKNVGSATIWFRRHSDRYLGLRAALHREKKPLCLMDIATIGAKYLKAQGILKNLDES